MDLFCSHEDTREILTPEMQHHGKEVCNGCGKFLRWIPKPDNEKVRRPAKHRDLVKKYSKGFCELCLKSEVELPNGQGLEAQHVIEFQDGGTEGRENIWIVCTACHKLIHWMRHHISQRSTVTNGDMNNVHCTSHS